MPKLSDSMEQGTILTWLKADGEQVQAGEDLLEIETDKATVTHPSDASGVLQIVAPQGTTLPVGAPIAHIGVAEGVRAGSSPEADGSSNDHPARIETNGAGVATSPPQAVAADAVGGNAVRATPLARRVAQAHGVSLDEVDGSGPLGRVTRGDVLTKAGVVPSRAPAEAPGLAVPAPAVPEPGGEPSGASSGKGTVEVVEPTRLQSVIARRMAEAKTTVPHFQVQTEVVMDAAVAFRGADTRGRCDRPVVQ